MSTYPESRKEADLGWPHNARACTSPVMNRRVSPSWETVRPSKCARVLGLCHLTLFHILPRMKSSYGPGRVRQEVE